jgi:hypothetical protein
MTIARTRKGSIKWSVKHRPPLSLVMIGSVLLFLLSSKEVLIDSLPISNAETKEVLGSWYMYVLKAGGALVAVLNIFLGLDKTDKA